ncbi:MAG TPA: hypothetical protein VMV44_00180 [Rectinemataceae bacterium]|nr:hypothetical protein [Rectinemataceae bacterium]
MKKTALPAAIVALASALSLGSCDAMFNTNLFKAANLGQFDLSKYSMKSLVDIAAAALSAPLAFYAQLAADASAKAEALTTLVQSPTAPVPSADPQTNVLAAAIIINTSPAGSVIDNVPKAVNYLTSLSDTTTVAPETILTTALTDILPPDANPLTGGTYDNFVAMMTAFTQASTLLSAVPVTSSTDPATGVTTYTMAAMPGATAQDTATYALLSIGLSGIEATTNPSPTNNILALWDAISTGDVSGITISTSVYDSSGPSTTITNLLKVLGLSF